MDRKFKLNDQPSIEYIPKQARIIAEKYIKPYVESVVMKRGGTSRDLSGLQELFGYQKAESGLFSYIDSFDAYEEKGSPNPLDVAVELLRIYKQELDRDHYGALGKRGCTLFQKANKFFAQSGVLSQLSLISLADYALCQIRFAQKDPSEDEITIINRLQERVDEFHDNNHEVNMVPTLRSYFETARGDIEGIKHGWGGHERSITWNYLAWFLKESQNDKYLRNGPSVVRKATAPVKTTLLRASPMPEKVAGESFEPVVEPSKRRMLTAVLSELQLNDGVEQEGTSEECIEVPAPPVLNPATHAPEPPERVGDESEDAIAADLALIQSKNVGVIFTKEEIDTFGSPPPLPPRNDEGSATPPVVGRGVNRQGPSTPQPRFLAAKANLRAVSQQSKKPDDKPANDIDPILAARLAQQRAKTENATLTDDDGGSLLPIIPGAISTDL